jgi:hypothetical protein
MHPYKDRKAALSTMHGKEDFLFWEIAKNRDYNPGL